MNRRRFALRFSKIAQSCGLRSQTTGSLVEILLSANGLYLTQLPLLSTKIEACSYPQTNSRIVAVAYLALALGHNLNLQFHLEVIESVNASRSARFGLIKTTVAELEQRQSATASKDISRLIYLVPQ